jgi:large subunit ribosomal protein L32
MNSNIVRNEINNIRIKLILILTFNLICYTISRNHVYFLKLIIMAVPKKRTSKAKKNARKANWKRKGYKAAQKSLSLAKSMLRGKTTSFVYSIYLEDQ